jgi:hypothetical protein
MEPIDSIGGSHSFDIQAAVEHVRWVSKWQSEGYILLAAMRDEDRCFVERSWINNRDPDLAVDVRRFLQRHDGDGLTILYSANSFAKKEAKAVDANPSRLAFVDADRSPLPLPGPSPSRIVESSPRNHHCFWVLSRPVSPADLQNINKALTHTVAGDKGGHSPAKLFRLPGTRNCKPKYDPPPLVKVTRDTGLVHDARKMLALAQKAAPTLSAAEFPATILREAQSLSASTIKAKYRRRLSMTTRMRLGQREIYGPFFLRICGKTYTYPGDDRSEIIWGIGADFRSAGASPAEVLAVVISTMFWRAREADGKHENPVRLLGRLFATEPARPLKHGEPS